MTTTQVQQTDKPEWWDASCKASASNWAAANPSDPFAYRHAMAQMRSGVAVPSDFHVEWRDETRSYESDGSVIEYTVKVPFSMKRP